MQKEWPAVSEKGAWCLDQVWKGTGTEGPRGGFEMSPGRRCGSGSAGRRPQVLVQHGDPLREQRIHIERELHGPLCRTGHAPHNVTSATRSAHPVFISRTRLQGSSRPHSGVQQPRRPHLSGQTGGLRATGLFLSVCAPVEARATKQISPGLDLGEQLRGPTRQDLSLWSCRQGEFGRTHSHCTAASTPTHTLHPHTLKSQPTEGRDRRDSFIVETLGQQV